jgi:hypothetical protein
MADESKQMMGESANKRKGTTQVVYGQPLKVEYSTDPNVLADIGNETNSPLPSIIAKTLAAYRDAAHKLLETRYAGMKEIAPLHMREGYSIFIILCKDGIFVRYDIAMRNEEKVFCTECDMGIAEIVPSMSDQIIHFPEDPKTYVPNGTGVELSMTKTDIKSGASENIASFRPLIYVSKTLAADYQIPPPPVRPPSLISVYNEFQFQLGGIIAPKDEPLDLNSPETQHFIAQGQRVRLPLGWQTIEVYPLLGEEYWKPEYAAAWAELDLLAAVVSQKVAQSALNVLDNRGATRKRYSALLSEFEALLNGLEEPVHQFLKQHPELICPTAEKTWSKLRFGDRVSDFVYREPYNDYLLVEIEAPIRELFRRDGQQREELTHAINQTFDWIQYIANSKKEVEEKLGLLGISTNPRTLVVIGRSALLTEENRRKLITLQAQNNKLRILTYDDLLATARATLEKILGPLDVQGLNVDLYYYKPSAAPELG